MARGSGSATGNGMQSSAAVKRILKEVAELAVEGARPGALFTAAPLETDLFEMHFTVRGPPETAFEGGLYHGRILLPPEYPLKAPEIMFLTPNGRFETGTRICLSVTSHHEELWQPSWGIRTILTALVGFMPSKPTGLGALDYPDKERVALAKKSLSYECPRCGAAVAAQLPPLAAPPAAPTEAATTATEAVADPSVAVPTAAAAAADPAPDDAGSAAVPADASSAVGDAAASSSSAATLEPRPPVLTGSSGPPSAAAVVVAAAALSPGAPANVGAPMGSVDATRPAAAPVQMPAPFGLRQRDEAARAVLPVPDQPHAVPRRPAREGDLSNGSGGEEVLLMAAWFVASIIGGLLARRLALALF
ncbi:hypothetical protein I4F81_008510 [Pyropia yezoensis]|uniref:Uncharacterized protein n=1 Tax=Pyropia yezoensis TaxID=2788 RepID=A0ACC3C7Q7_PYRYE|nr:hypothetical protein I4F81_008510 [Neopyropia yezoensis]|eukprot:contig_6721_g1545